MFPRIVDFMGFQKATLYKPTFIKEMLGFGTIVWIDADCEVLNTFELPSGDWDVGFMPHPIDKNRDNYTPWCGFLIALKPTEKTKRFVDLWEYLCQWQGLRQGDHERMMWALATMQSQEHKIEVINLLQNLRGNIYMDPRHRKRTTFEDVPIELDSFNPVLRATW